MNNEASKPTIPAQTANVQEIIRKANDIYATLKPQLEPQYNGKYVAIEVESGEHFIGETREEAVAKSGAKYPTKLTFTRRIGEPDKASRSSHRMHKYYDRAF